MQLSEQMGGSLPIHGLDKDIHVLRIDGMANPPTDSHGVGGLVYDTGGNALAAFAVPPSVSKTYSAELTALFIGLILHNQLQNTIVRIEGNWLQLNKEITQPELLSWQLDAMDRSILLAQIAYHKCRQLYLICR